MRLSRCYPIGVAVARPLFGAFVLGLGTRRWLRRHLARLYGYSTRAAATGLALTAALLPFAVSLA